MGLGFFYGFRVLCWFIFLFYGFWVLYGFTIVYGFKVFRVYKGLGLKHKIL